MAKHFPIWKNPCSFPTCSNIVGKSGGRGYCEDLMMDAILYLKEHENGR